MIHGRHSPIPALNTRDPRWHVWDMLTVCGLHLGFHTMRDLKPREALQVAKEMTPGATIRCIWRVR